MNILLIGATGYIGSAVANHLTAAGHQVVGLSPSGGDRTGDLKDPDSLTRAVTPDIDAVVNLAPPTGDASVDAAAMAALGLTPPKTPSPWNLFMNIPVQADGRVSFEPPLCKAGDYLVLRAEMDCVIAFSACPQDIVPINGLACTPTEAHFEILEAVRGG
jgi:NAD(P)-dependent dehydrogenase (short-subunit alcohol dehydrogenase family)